VLGLVGSSARHSAHGGCLLPLPAHAGVPPRPSSFELWAGHPRPSLPCTLLYLQDMGRRGGAALQNPSHHHHCLHLK
jgi:hypothetical protein